MIIEWLKGLDWFYLLVQGIGFLATILGIVSFQQKTQRGIVVFQLVNHVLWMTHFLLLGALAGCMLNGIGIFRCIVFYFRKDRKWAQNPVWYGIFGALIVAASAFSWVQGDGAEALLPMCAMFFTTWSLSLQDPFRVRVLAFLGSPFWLAYNVINLSIPGIITEICSITSIIVGVLRHDLPKLKQKRHR